MITEQAKRHLRWSDLVAVGRVMKAHGRHGEVAVDPFTDTPDRFSELSRVYSKGPVGDEAVSFRIEGVRPHKGRPILKLEGISGIGAAEELVGWELRIPASETKPLPEGSFYHFEIVGLDVHDRRRGYLGVVEEVMPTGGADVLVVRRAGATGRAETLLPLCREICRRIDPLEARIEVDAPEGLVDLNAN